MGDMQFQKEVEQIAEMVTNGQIIADEHLGQFDREYELGEMMDGWDFIQDCYDFRYLISSHGEIIEARVQVAGGGPDIWLHMWPDGSGEVVGKWWGDSARATIYSDPMGVFDAAETLRGCLV